MKILLANRIFKHKEKVYPDPNRNLDPKDVLLFYSNTNPQLASCSVTDKVIDNEGNIVYECKEGFTPKG